MASIGVWSDFETIRHSVKNNTVDKLKQILSGLNEECGSHLIKTGKKQEVIERIVSALDGFRDHNLEDRWLKAKAIIAQVRSGIYTMSRMAANSVILPPPGLHNMNHAMKNVPFVSALPGSNTVARYDPYAPPRKPSGPVASTSSSTTKPAVEFPPTCEVRVNNVQLTANLKGLKKKPGTAPPPDIGKYCRLTAIPNKIEMVYVNSQQPVQPKASLSTPS
ncbi:hypothetical protein H0H87_002232 [Tephrocybe sp. NHM501043]|nr:hypothetical protein H0H87_002232 [Tephrocybe sp. NHM501043]